MSNEIKIRSLTVNDRKRLSSLIQKLADKVGDRSMLNMISSQIKDSGAVGDSNTEKEDGYTQVGIKILLKIVEILETETHAWFADLIGVTEEEFLKLPMDTEMIIIEQIVNAQEASSFFTKALQLFKRIKQFQNRQGR